MDLSHWGKDDPRSSAMLGVRRAGFLERGRESPKGPTSVGLEEVRLVLLIERVVQLGVRWCSGGAGVRRCGGQAEALEDGPYDGWMGDERDEPAPAGASSISRFSSSASFSKPCQSMRSDPPKRSANQRAVGA